MLDNYHMRRVTNPEEFRGKIRTELNKLVGDEKVTLNLEKGILNYCLEAAELRNVVKKWDNIYFTHIYIDRLRSIMMNLRRDKALLERVQSKKVKAHVVAFMTHQDMSPDKWQELIDEKKIRDENRYAPKLDANTDNFTCRRCKSKRCSYYQLQTRSADEPMTTFVTCIDCGNRWKC